MYLCKTCLGSFWALPAARRRHMTRLGATSEIKIWTRDQEQKNSGWGMGAPLQILYEPVGSPRCSLTPWQVGIQPETCGTEREDCMVPGYLWLGRLQVKFVWLPATARVHCGAKRTWIEENRKIRIAGERKATKLPSHHYWLQRCFLFPLSRFTRF